MLDSIKHLLHTLYDVQGLIRWGGILGVCTIVFIETGFFVGFFLPGDSLLVTAGIFAAAHLLDLKTLFALSALCAIAGDQVGYWIGRSAGPALFKRENSLIFKRRHLDRAHAFYEKYGGKTVILARYVPIIRTFCPPVAGAAGMPYTRYFGYDVIGGLLWVGTMEFGGYFLGSLVPNIDKRIHYVIAVVVFLSLLPAIIGWWNERRKSHHSAHTPNVGAELASARRAPREPSPERD
ncbi:MAG TPA: VTT domain-containing protein [Candidatus Acidoferrales bacterium]|nr:VTT domain-containing protein [Candidatus Acidoferrales bacterium]